MGGEGVEFWVWSPLWYLGGGEVFLAVIDWLIGWLVGVG